MTMIMFKILIDCILPIIMFLGIYSNSTDIDEEE